jgi:hypothetical protein
MRLWMLLVVLVVVGVAACGDNDQAVDPGELVASSIETTQVVPSTMTSAATSSTTLAAAPTTTAAATTSTPITVPVSSTTTVATRELPPFFRYGTFGVIEVVVGHETVLVDEPVAWASSDGAGGLVFQDWSQDAPTLWWLPAGGPEPVEAPLGYVGAIINLDGRAAVVRYDDWEERRCESDSIGVYDLDTGLREDFVVCSGDGDVGWFPSTYGGGLFAGVRWDASGTCGTDSGILFWDRSGAPADVAINPYPVSLDQGPGISGWIPCELDARLSPDGRLLAYRFRPDNKWPCPEYDEVPYEVWLKESRSILGEVVVLDIETGSVVYQAPSEAEERLTDFDGRFLVLTTAHRRDDVPPDQVDWVFESRIVDITAANPDHRVDGRVRLIWTATD